MYIGGEVYDVGTVGIDDSNTTVSIAVITLSIVGALVLGAVMASAVMFHIRKKKKGENILMLQQQHSPAAITCFCAHYELLSPARPSSEHREPFIDDALTHPLERHGRFFPHGRLQTR